VTITLRSPRWGMIGPTGPIVGLAVTEDGTLLASVSSDGSVKIYDVLGFGLPHAKRREGSDRSRLRMRTYLTKCPTSTLTSSICDLLQT